MIKRTQQSTETTVFDSQSTMFAIQIEYKSKRIFSSLIAMRAQKKTSTIKRSPPPQKKRRKKKKECF